MERAKFVENQVKLFQCYAGYKSLPFWVSNKPRATILDFIRFIRLIVVPTERSYCFMTMRHTKWRRAGNLTPKMVDICTIFPYALNVFQFISTNFQFRQYLQQFNGNLFQQRRFPLKLTNSAMKLTRTGKIIIWSKNSNLGKPACHYTIAMETSKTADKHQNVREEQLLKVWASQSKSKFSKNLLQFFNAI